MLVVTRSAHSKGVLRGLRWRRVLMRGRRALTGIEELDAALEVRGRGPGGHVDGGRDEVEGGKEAKATSNIIKYFTLMQYNLSTAHKSFCI